MQQAACRLTKSIGYSGVGTVEYLYDIEKKKFYFLELNPRLQVEHPVTESVTGVNIPSVQLQIGMGIPLHEMSDIRKYFLRGLPGPDVGQALDFSRRVPIYNHCIAARITSENPEDAFMPCSGAINRIDFQSTHGEGK
jgi:biotin carboxylase